MAVELLGARMVAPFYGTSLFVWTSILVTTLGGLALGYFIGGKAAKKNPESALFTALLTGSIFLGFMPVISPWLLEMTLPLGLRAGSLLSCLGFMLIPLCCMGMVSPLIIQQVSTEVKFPGNAAGTVYAVSTLGGILFTLILGFFIIPEFGIRKPAFAVAFLLGTAALGYFMIRKRYLAVVSGAAAILLLSASGGSPKERSSGVKVRYLEEGILGQVMVMDQQVIEEGQPKIERRLFVNRIIQTYTQVGFEGASLWAYPHQLSLLASINPPGKKALVLGFACGTGQSHF